MNKKELDKIIDLLFIDDLSISGKRKLTTYINDLQEENERLKEENKEYEMIFDTFSSRPYAHRYLEEKKKELNNPHIIGLDSEMIYKDYYDLKEEHEKCTRKHWQSKCAEYSIKNKLLQNKIDKAIDYINRNTCANVEEQCNSIYLYDEYLNHLLDILRGKDNG